MKLKDVFDYIDRDRSDSLDRREVATLMRELVPEVRTADILFFSGLLDIDGTDRLTYAQLLDGIRECLGVQRACEDPEQRELAQVLSLVRDFCGQNRAAVVKEWRRADVTGRGCDLPLLSQRTLSRSPAHPRASRVALVEPHHRTPTQTDKMTRLFPICSGSFSCTTLSACSAACPP